MTTSLRSKLAAIALLGGAIFPSAHAAGPVKFGLCYDISKIYVAAVPQVAQAVKDYADLLNLRGGIEGHPIEVTLIDHGNEPQRGIDCYERLKRDGVMVFDFFSTPVSRAVLPRIMQDGNILVQPLVGRGDAVDGEVFKNVFPLAPTYWGQAANIVSYFKKQAKGELQGKKVAFLYLDTPFGREPIPVFEALKRLERFDFQTFPFPVPGNDQSAAFAQIRRFQPDWVVLWSFSPLNPISFREMQRNGIPLERMVTVNWINEVDINNFGAAAAKGLKRSAVVSGGAEHPLVQDILRELYDKGKGNGDRKLVADSYYNTGLAVYSSVFEGVRHAVKSQGWPLTPEKIRKGMYSLKNYDAKGFMPPITVTPQDHGGGGRTRIDMWDGSKWVPQTPWIADYTGLVNTLVKANSAEFAKANK
ncbi:ABC transporter substrate-binding protein [Ramlibacter albus]|uniref:ABC transporter substrate-binding protein n=1 Tax=Ramlibacter albus TaxID=2079448 RepID=A0A923M306_9BURK|nr:ABC transporter substrate-binding protein [Ramlibacter albus]MBC5762975.1 ABC transporter substrate-binding protein [Ramlibacter albus]